MTELLRRGLLGERALQRRGPGALLQPDRPAGPERARAPTRAGCCPRSSPTSAGASRATPAAAGFRTFFKGGWRGTGAGQLVHEAALFERRRHARLDGCAHRRQPVARIRHRDAARRGAASLPWRRAAPSRRRGRRRPGRRRAVSAAPRPPAAPVWWTCTATRRASGSKLAYRDGAQQHRSPLPGYCENWALMHGRAAFSLGQVQRYLRRNGPRPPDPRRLPPGCERREALVRWAERTGRGDLVGTYIAQPQPPQHRAARWTSRSSAHSDGKRLRMGGFDHLGAERAHLQRARAHPPQPAHPEERDGALRLRALPGASGGTSSTASARTATWT